MAGTVINPISIPCPICFSVPLRDFEIAAITTSTTSRGTTKTASAIHGGHPHGDFDDQDIDERSHEGGWPVADSLGPSVVHH